MSQQIVYTGTMNRNGRTLNVVLPQESGQNVVWNEIVVEQCYAPIPGIGEVEQIVDFGANTGLASAYFRLHYEHAELVSIEPDKRAYAFLEMNASNIGKCRTFCCGLSNSNSTRPLFQLESSVFSTKNSYSNTISAQNIEVRDADEMLRDSGVAKIDVIKIDTEGSEVPILYSLSKNYLPKAKVIYLEFHSHTDRMLIDVLLNPTHVLWRAVITNMNRGTLAYVNRSCETLQSADTAL